MAKLVPLFITCSVLIHVASAARILGIVPTPSYSHQVVFQPLWRELSLRGHHVTTLTTDPIKDPGLTNLTEIDLHFSYEEWNKMIMKNVLTFNDNIIGTILSFIDHTMDMYEQQLRHPSVQDLIKGDHRFDLVIIEGFAPMMSAFAQKIQCPFIAMISTDGFTDQFKQVGNPTHLVVYPDLMHDFDVELPFLQRLKSVVFAYVFQLLGIYGNYLQARLVEKHFGPNFPAIDDIMSNVSMLFVNADPVFHKIRPLVPAVVQIGGGTHLRPPKPLPPHLQQRLDSAKDGFIYFSLGSNVKSKDIPAETRAIILETFSELPYTILWKFEAENLPNKSDNVIISKWLPQQDVLRHPNIKLFITQGGLQSSDETIYTGVPIVGMPFFGDQMANIKKMVAKGVGLSVDYTSLEREDFKRKIQEVIRNPKYRNRIKELAELAQDQPMTGLERAVWWSEYVIRHKGAHHLRSPLLDIPWYQYLFLDVIAVLLFVFTLTMYICYKFIRSLFYLLRRILYNRTKKLV
ncbi:hypothetical protein PPYR_14637 [Photinus pyralis]|uniref:UDP-glucuronosyltransferase n=2 Tax=Photinus pyralis TaxID=7054 RepID=A0A5N4A5Y2_PHOPY|nr:UDP-glucuronosyltransferase 1-3-like isoform X1 [Photinus pyralis]KAB0792678.1 hypothetical protein PPYR_14637 [Photinus pyralis]